MSANASQLTKKIGCFSKRQHTNPRQSLLRATAVETVVTKEVTIPIASRIPDPKLTLRYKTTWKKPQVHYSVDGRDWKTATLPKISASDGKWYELQCGKKEQSSNGAPALEFVVTDGEGGWDKAGGGENYKIWDGGEYMLSNGKVRCVSDSKVCLVSDIDGTMYGDDVASRKFKALWESELVGKGWKLVYNTGRALDICIELFKDKKKVLPQPDALICAVGTRVYYRRGDKWEVDEEWLETLDHYWDLQAVRNAAYSTLQQFGKESMHFRPPEEQNEFKVTCGVACGCCTPVVNQIQRTLLQEGVQAQLIVCGKGDWRFLDIVPLNAGKYKALEYVSKKLGFPVSQTICCGDSGNDKVMLEGDCRAIVVGNSQPDLMSWATKYVAGSNGNGNGANRLFIATEDMAAGIRQGLKHFGVL